ncbi:DUF1990 domain-containing protein [Nocardioides sp. ChNu-153]|uniref:DUF1990 family protein n=1 Tax=Nocardioides sp. ChNu-153 TaxID=2779364 RepID=UPI002654DECB|nr:DUF1990 domain-containing protein [Nocardioides sp. ChNu-153]MDN7121407.1 DUF1990 domain-containing protein [Nocardioides sp. ChNu-153]
MRPPRPLLPLREDRGAALRAQAPTYDALLRGRTLAAGAAPARYAGVEREQVVGRGGAAFARAATALGAWEVQRRAGVGVRADGPATAEGSVAELLLGAGPLGVRAPVLVVAAEATPRRVGYAYGTLPGHPEEGEEAFVVEHRADDTVVLVVRAFSRPATWWSRLGAPVTAVVQRRVTDRYLAALTGGTGITGPSGP